jgi:hypothetical protein
MMIRYSFSKSRDVDEVITEYSQPEYIFLNLS